MRKEHSLLSIKLLCWLFCLLEEIQMIFWMADVIKYYYLLFLKNKKQSLFVPNVIMLESAWFNLYWSTKSKILIYFFFCFIVAWSWSAVVWELHFDCVRPMAARDYWNSIWNCKQWDRQTWNEEETQKRWSMWKRSDFL